MKFVKVAAGVLNQTPLDWEGNRERIRMAIAAAREAEVSVLCLPEMCIPGYGCEDMFHSPLVQQSSLEMLESLLPDTQGMIVSFGLPLLVQNAVYNTACLVADGELLGFVAKQHLAGDGIHYEHRWFKPWPNNAVVEIRVGEGIVPVGDLHFDCGGIKIGFEICEDAWVARRPGSELSLQGVDLILNPSASHFAFGKLEIRKRFVLEGSRAFSTTYLYANLLGNESGRIIYDGGALIASGNRMLATGPRFSFEDVCLTTAVIDVDLTRTQQSQRGGFYPDFSPENGLCLSAPFEYPQISPLSTSPELETWEESETLKEEEFTRAETLGLFDYMRKSFSNGFVVSLSGGADSAAVAVLVSQVVHRGIQELGRERFLEKLGYLTELQNWPDERSLIAALLTTAYQSTRNSSDTTRNAARGVAEAIGATHLELDVDQLVAGYTEIVSEAVNEELTWENHDLTLQNIQARVRSPSVWMLANMKRALLLATSNRSEAAVGYATMDGDTSGGLSPIAGIDKAFLRSWLVWMETQGPHDFASIPELSAITQQAPTAELRPAAAEQTDEADLMPYVVLDAIERLAIRDKKSPLEVFQLLSGQYPGETPKTVAGWTERFFRLWCRNQWKRERYAPSFHLDDENLDPKTWCRFPILSSGFQRELNQLRQLVESLPE